MPYGPFHGGCYPLAHNAFFPLPDAYPTHSHPHHVGYSPVVDSPPPGPGPGPAPIPAPPLSSLPVGPELSDKENNNNADTSRTWHGPSTPGRDNLGERGNTAEMMTMPTMPPTTSAPTTSATGQVVVPPLPPVLGKKTATSSPLGSPIIVKPTPKRKAKAGSGDGGGGLSESKDEAAPPAGDAPSRAVARKQSSIDFKEMCKYFSGIDGDDASKHILSPNVSQRLPSLRSLDPAGILEGQDGISEERWRIMSRWEWGHGACR